MSIERVERSGGVVYRVRWRDAAGRNRSRVLGRKRDAEAFDAEVKRRKRTSELGLMDAGRETLDEYHGHLGVHPCGTPGAQDSEDVREHLRPPHLTATRE